MNFEKFTSLTVNQKIDLLVKAQEIMLRSKKTNTSKYLATQQNIESYKEQFVSLIKTYRGNIYQDDNSVLLFNFVKLPSKPIKDINLKELAAILKSRAPEEDYDAISIDFFVSADILNIFKAKDALLTPQLKYAVFARHNDLRIYPIADLLKSITGRA